MSKYPESEHCQLSSTVRYVSTLFILSVLVTFSLNSCSEDCKVCPQLPETGNVTVAADTHGAFCATYYSGGDYDFNGHGPEVFLEAEVYVSGDSLMFFFFVDAIETQSDWTRGAGRWDRLLYQAPAGYRITAVDTPVVCRSSYTDVNHAMDFIDCEDIKFWGYGDCDGNDVGSGCVCTKYWVWIRDINVEITRD